MHYFHYDTIDVDTEVSAKASHTLYYLFAYPRCVRPFFRLSDRDMWNGLESEAAVAAWDMVETGRILVPHILDQPFIDNRPPGAWWLIAATYKLAGVRSTWTARLPSALAALLCILLVYAMGRRAANARAGFSKMS